MFTRYIYEGNKTSKAIGDTMKKKTVICIVCVCALILAVCALPAFASPLSHVVHNTWCKADSACEHVYVDANNNGVCDHRENGDCRDAGTDASRTRGCGNGHHHGTSNCSRYGTGHANGYGCANGYDHCANGYGQSGDGCGQGYCGGNGN